MKTLQYKKIDAFTKGESLGNPAACIYLAQGQTLSEAEMQDIAKRHKGFVSEVVYCAPISPTEFTLTYYSSECEVEFCGHGTIACMYSLIKETPFLQGRKEVTIHTAKQGSLTVFNEIETQDAVYITAPQPRYIESAIELKDLAENMSLDIGQILTSRPVDIIDAGLKTLIVPIAALRDEISVFPNESQLKKFCLINDIDIVLIYTLETVDSRNIAHTRVFAPKFGYLEDPATGSGNSAFGYYMLRNSLWDGSAVTIEQGGCDRIFNSVSLLKRGSRVLFGGRAATRINGVYYLS
ncbi:MAG: PhzF family phenazine biosynthesis isomerase [Oscillospiraceae bacterium]|jgi:PhzF family phenazine biosynthesis protein|nr:PhzF family phenazine biosynthesis isomerase [Oscillospiraceae bacterium]